MWADKIMWWVLAAGEMTMSCLFVSKHEGVNYSNIALNAHSEVTCCVTSRLCMRLLRLKSVAFSTSVVHQITSWSPEVKIVINPASWTLSNSHSQGSISEILMGEELKGWIIHSLWLLDVLSHSWESNECIKWSGWQWGELGTVGHLYYSFILEDRLKASIHNWIQSRFIIL